MIQLLPRIFAREYLPSGLRKGEKCLKRALLKEGHSIKICSTVNGTRQSSQWGWGLPHIRKPWVSLVWPILSLHKAVSHLLGIDGYDHGLVQLVKAFILLGPTWSHRDCHRLFIYSRMDGRKSGKGIEQRSGRELEAASFARWSADSFPGIPTWEGTQQNCTLRPRRLIKTTHSKIFDKWMLWIIWLQWLQSTSWITKNCKRPLVPRCNDFKGF